MALRPVGSGSTWKMNPSRGSMTLVRVRGRVRVRVKGEGEGEARPGGGSGGSYYGSLP